MKIFCSKCQKVIEPEIPEGAQEINCPLCSAALAVPESPLSPGAVIGDFLLEKHLSDGGMGMVYLARQISLDRPVALKVLRDKFADNPEYVDGLFREARAAAKLTHPNIVQAYAVGEENGIFYFAMEFIRGETFKQILKKQNVLDFDLAVKVIKEICGALQAAWNEQKLVHQDIKPDNIMLDQNGFAKLADLGLARTATDAGPADDENEVLGTPQYISPEQLTGVPTDVRSDIYSLGATFYQFVTGQFPYPEESAEAMAHKHVEGNLTPPVEINQELPKPLSDIIVKMMARNIEERYQNPVDVIKDLEAYERKKSASVSMPKLSLNFNKKAAPGTPAAPGKMASPGVGFRPGTPAKPAAQVKPAPAVKPAAPAKSAVAVKPAAPVKPATPAKPAVPEKPAAPAAQAPEEPKAEVKQEAVPATPAPAPVPAAPGKSDELTLAPKAPKSAPADEEKKEEPKGKKDAKKDKDKKEKRIERPSRNKAMLISWGIGLPVILLLLAVLFYILAAKGKLPEKLKATGDKYAAAINSMLKIKGNASEAQSAEGKAAAETAPKAAPAPQVTVLPPPPKPVPVTRKEFISGVEKLLSDYQNNPDKGIEFLNKTDEFMANFLPAVTKEEEKALASLRIAYGPADELLRVNPARLKAQKAIEMRVEAEKKAFADEEARKLREEARKREEAAAAAAQAAASGAEQLRQQQELAKRTAELKVILNDLYKQSAEGFLKAVKNNDKQLFEECRKKAAEYFFSANHNSPEELNLLAQFKEFYTKFLPAAFREFENFYTSLKKINQESPVTISYKSSMVDIIQVVPGKTVSFKTGDGSVRALNMRSRLYRERLFKAMELPPHSFVKHVFYYEFIEGSLSVTAMKQLPGGLWPKYIKYFVPVVQMPSVPQAPAKAAPAAAAKKAPAKKAPAKKGGKK